MPVKPLPKGLVTGKGVICQKCKGFPCVCEANAGRYKGLVTGVGPQLPGDVKRQAKATKPGRKRHTPGKMNQAEAKYAAILEIRRAANEIIAWQFEAVTLKLAAKPPGSKMKGVRFTPDFVVWMADNSIEFHEVKGFWEGDAIVKWKVAIERYPMFRFVLVEE